jgi:CRISPR-associated protein Cmr2
MQPFHFTITPVQSFVAQARRTRDLWAGSYLLSYLAGTAMKAITDSGGKIIFPAVDKDPLFKAIKNSSGIDKDNPAARIGSLPNRFKAGAEDPANAACAAKAAIQDAWQKISEAVLKKIKEKANGDFSDDTSDIWQRQICNHWEVSWIVGDDGFLLDKRKNLRNFFPEPEHGEKCTICGERQALSKGKNDSRHSVVNWWKQFAANFNGQKGYHFKREGERLCAICTIKRVFPVEGIAKAAIDWDVYHNYPSTAYMAAVDWLIELLKKAETDTATAKALDGFINICKKADIAHEAATTIKAISDITDRHLDWKAISDFRGDVFFPDAIKNEKDFPINANIKRTDLIEKLKDLTDAAGFKPTPFYALLVMDGDNMGKLLSRYSDKQTAISTALADFADSVLGTIEDRHNGKLIYAGGDDVMALLPLNTALHCAAELREAYLKSFSRNVPEATQKGGGTISAGIVFAHMNTPLQAVVRDAHKLLDGTAKDLLDRDAFAVRVWKRGGALITFGKKWKDPQCGSWIDEIEMIKDDFNKGKYGSGYFYRFRGLTDILNALDNAEDRIRLLTAEYLKSRENRELPEKHEERLKEAEQRVRRLYDLSLYPNQTKDEEVEIKPNADALLFVRFLAEKEI